LTFLYTLLALVLLVVISVWLYIKRKGDCHFEFLVDQRTKFEPTEIKDTYVVFSCQVPFINNGTQDGTLIDVHMRTLLPKEQFDKVNVDAWLYSNTDPRNDAYWEASLIPFGKGGTVTVQVKLTAYEGDIRAALAEMVDMPMYIVFEVVGRRPIAVHKNYMVMTMEETRGSVGQARVA
jgi:hypothetical protein